MSIAEISPTKTDPVEALVDRVFRGEEVLSLKEFCRRQPRPLSIQAGYRWNNPGVGGVRLEFLQHGRDRLIHRDHFRDFIIRRTQIARGEAEPQEPEAIKRAEKKRLDALEAECAARGI